MNGALLVFILAALVDVLAVQWTLAATRMKAVRAGVYAGAIAGVSLLTIFMVVDTVELIVPSVLGHMAGSFVAVKEAEWRLR